MPTASAILNLTLKDGWNLFTAKGAEGECPALTLLVVVVQRLGTQTGGADASGCLSAMVVALVTLSVHASTHFRCKTRMPHHMIWIVKQANPAGL